jgi:hypothetical protein
MKLRGDTVIEGFAPGMRARVDALSCRVPAGLLLAAVLLLRLCVPGCACCTVPLLAPEYLRMLGAVAGLLQVCDDAVIRPLHRAVQCLSGWVVCHALGRALIGVLGLNVTTPRACSRWNLVFVLFFS